MTSATIPTNEEQRLAALGRYEILDSIPERAYEDLLAIAAGICGTPMGAISMIDSERQWFKAQKGLSIQETSRDVSFCAHAILGDGVFVVPDARMDERFHDNPLVTGNPGIRFYAGAPLVSKGGEALGALCVIDDQPREISEAQRQALVSLSRQVVSLLELRLAHKELRNHLGEREWYERILHIREQELLDENLHLAKMSRTDALTGLLNRRSFNSAIEAAVGLAASVGTPLALAIIDIDFFKALNDAYGHPAGDAALAAIARTLESQMPAGATLARFGGEEFAVVLPGHGAGGAVLVCDRMRRVVEQLAHDPPLTISVGVAVFRSGDAVSDIYSRADAALYAAKRGGRNRVEMND